LERHSERTRLADVAVARPSTRGGGFQDGAVFTLGVSPANPNVKDYAKLKLWLTPT
jgi:hypothetical protein